jgi:hypothetical protein
MTTSRHIRGNAGRFGQPGNDLYQKGNIRRSSFDLIQSSPGKQVRTIKAWRPSDEGFLKNKKGQKVKKWVFKTKKKRRWVFG